MNRPSVKLGDFVRKADREMIGKVVGIHNDTALVEFENPGSTITASVRIGELEKVEAAPMPGKSNPFAS